MIRSLFKKYIRGTEKKTIVQMVNLFMCHLTVAVVKGASFPCNKVYLNTRVLKHCYDKRTAEEFDFLMENLMSIIRYPNKVYKNKDGKRGGYCLVKEIKNNIYLCSIQFNEHEEKTTMAFDIVTFFRTDENYLRNCELLWEWKGGTPSS